MKIQNMLTMSSIITSLVLIFSFQVLAGEVEIQGWDKAKFGMSPEEVRSAYAEEEEYFKPGAFWEEQREDKLSHFPYTLFTSRVTVLERGGTVILFFVNDRLFEIIVAAGHVGKVTDFVPGEFIRRWEEGKPKGIMTLEERKRKMMEALEQLKLMKEERQKEATKDEISGTDIRSFGRRLTYSFGFDIKWKEERIRDGMKENKPLELLTNKHEEASIIEWGDGAIHRWDDEKGNILLLRDYVPLSADAPDYLHYYSFIITYTSRELMNLWIAKIEEWEKEHKRITEKGIEVF